MKTIVYFLAFVLLSFAGSAYGEGIPPPIIHIVRAGECLSAIAHKYLGSYERWPELAQLNGLSNPHLIVPGQRILVTKASLSEEESLRLAREVIWSDMIRRFQVRHHRTFDMRVVSRKWALKPLQLVTVDTSTVEAAAILKEVRLSLEWQDLLQIYQAICAETETAEDALTLAALIRHESEYRNVPGSHGEIGPTQIKPTTAVSILQGFMQPDSPLDAVTEALWGIRTNVHAGWRHFKKCLAQSNGSVLLAFRQYNNGSGRVGYADEVSGKRASLLYRYNSEVKMILTSKHMKTVLKD